MRPEKGSVGLESDLSEAFWLWGIMRQDLSKTEGWGLSDALCLEAGQHWDLELRHDSGPASHDGIFHRPPWPILSSGPQVISYGAQNSQAGAKLTLVS